jgi:proline iminopeptidase
LLARVRAAGDARAEAALAALGPPPWEVEQTLAERRILNRHPPASERGIQRRVIAGLITAPGYSLRQALDWFGGGSFSIVAMRGALFHYSDGPPYPPLALPFVVIQGAEDIQTPTTLAAEYLDAIEAPSKRFVTLPGGGHMVMVAMQDAFLEALLTHVRPLATG